MMNNSDIMLAYRSLFRPDPIWPEIGLYGGYNYIEVAPNLWMPRSVEGFLLSLQTNMPENIRTLITELVKQTKPLIPTELQQNNLAKLSYTLKTSKIFAVFGFSAELQQLLQTIPYTTFYTNTDEYALVGAKVMPDYAILDATAHMLTLLPADDTRLKSDVRNWSNVIAYDHTSFSSGEINLLTGGNYE